MVLVRDRGRPRLWRSARGSSVARGLLLAAQVARERWQEREAAMGGPIEEALPRMDVEVSLLEEDGTPAVFDRYSNAFIKIYFPIPEGRGDEMARKVLIKHLQEGNSYGIRLKEIHAKFPQPELGPWVENSKRVGENYQRPVLEGWEPPLH